MRLPGHLIVLPTEAGNTRLTVEWIASKWANGEEIELLWVSHLAELVKQTLRHFSEFLGRSAERRRYVDGE